MLGAGDLIARDFYIALITWHRQAGPGSLLYNPWGRWRISRIVGLANEKRLAIQLNI